MPQCTESDQDTQEDKAMNWKPIETAPKDADILVATYNARGEFECMAVACWSDTDMDGCKSPGWYLYSGKHHFIRVDYAPTHWAKITPPKGVDVTDKSKFEGWNEPDSRKFLDDITPWMENARHLTLSPDQVMTVFLCLSRYHDLEDFGYSRDFEAIATYCPRTDDDD